jgi:hypothetical protein
MCPPKNRDRSEIADEMGAVYDLCSEEKKRVNIQVNLRA